MKNIQLLLCYTVLSYLSMAQSQSYKVSAVYGGSPIYINASKTIPELRNSGFTTVIVWTIHIDATGNFDFNMEFPLVKNGAYVGTAKHPDFPSSIAILKTPPTSVNRVEFGLSGYGSSTFQNIKDLINAQGTGPTSILYRNFKVLKDSIPAIDAFNFDDESTYDVNSSVKLAVMLNALGFKVALCPYTQQSYWNNVASQANSQSPGCVDFIFLQCYDGGANNNPGLWNFSGLAVYPGLWDKNCSPAVVENKMSTWKNQYGTSGGFMWLYDDFFGKELTKQYAAALNKAFAIGAPEKAANEIPSNGGTTLNETVSLNWQGGSYTQSHDIYFGASEPPEFKANQTQSMYNPGKLKPNTKYYWRIDEINFFGTTIGMVWSFTTGNMGTLIESQKSLSPYPLAIRSVGNNMIYFSLPEETAYILSIYTLKGKMLFDFNGYGTAGLHSKWFDNSRISRSIYYMRLRIKSGSPTKKAVIYEWCKIMIAP